MEWTLEGRTFTRVRQPLVHVLLTGWTGFMFFGALSGFSPALSAAVGMGAVFCGVTNSPISSFIICCEMFGFEGSAYFLLACVISYVVSGYYGLYTSQKIIYSKFRLSYIDKRTL